MLCTEHLVSHANVEPWHREMLEILEGVALSCGLSQIRVDRLVTFPMCERATISCTSKRGCRVWASADLYFMRNPGGMREDELAFFRDWLKRDA